MNHFVTLLLFFFFAPLHSSASTHLLLVGGGKRPIPAMKQLSSWAGGSSARMLIIGWASTIPEDYVQSISADLSSQGVHTFLVSLSPPKTELEKEDFLSLLNQATGVFFTGGDQNRAMAAITKWDLKPELLKRFQSGIPFAGTSAGTALMAEHMMTGDENDPIEPGLGLFQKAIIDMHFLKRNREPRLLAAMNHTGHAFGIGIDEDGALAIDDSERAIVLGDPHVVFYQIKPSEEVKRDELKNEDQYNLNIWSNQ
jgi:cyanophycinase